MQIVAWIAPVGGVPGIAESANGLCGCGVNRAPTPAPSDGEGSGPMSETDFGLSDWLEQAFFGTMELSFLSTPAFAVVIGLQGYHPDAVSLAGLAAIAAGSLSLAVFRARRVDVGDWPRRGELTSMPLRVVYFSAVFLVATLGVAVVVVAVGSWWFTLLGAVVEAAGLAAFPRVYRSIHGEPLQKPAHRL